MPVTQKQIQAEKIRRASIKTVAPKNNLAPAILQEKIKREKVKRSSKPVGAFNWTMNQLVKPISSATNLFEDTLKGGTAVALTPFTNRSLSENLNRVGFNPIQNQKDVWTSQNKRTFSDITNEAAKEQDNKLLRFMTRTTGYGGDFLLDPLNKVKVASLTAKGLAAKKTGKLALSAAQQANKGQRALLQIGKTNILPSIGNKVLQGSTKLNDALRATPYIGKIANVASKVSGKIRPTGVSREEFKILTDAKTAARNTIGYTQDKAVEFAKGIQKILVKKKATDTQRAAILHAIEKGDKKLVPKGFDDVFEAGSKFKKANEEAWKALGGDTLEGYGLSHVATKEVAEQARKKSFEGGGFKLTSTHTPQDIHRQYVKIGGKPLQEGVAKTNPLIQEARKYKSADEFRKDYQASHLMDLSNPEKHRYGRLLEDGVDETTGKYMDAKRSADMYGSRGNNEYKYQREANVPDVKSKDELVTIYRGTKKTQKEMLPGDFVSFNKEYALSHNEGEKLLTMKVPAKDVVFQGNDFHEWIYSPEKLRGGEDYTGGLEKIWKEAQKSQPLQEGGKGEVLYHGGSKIDEVKLGKGNFSKTFYMSDDPNYAKSFGGKNSVVNKMELSPNANLADMRKPSDELINKIDEIASGTKTGKTLKIQRPDGSFVSVPETPKDSVSFHPYSKEQVIQGLKDGKANFAELPEVKKILKDLGYDGQITSEVPYAKNVGIWNKDVVKKASQPLQEGGKIVNLQKEGIKYIDDLYEKGKGGFIDKAGNRVEVSQATAMEINNEMVKKGGKAIFQEDLPIVAAKMGISTGRKQAATEFLEATKGLKGEEAIALANEVHNKMVNPESLRKAIQGFDAIQNIWKAQALVAPSYHIRNFAGNLWNNYLADVQPASYALAGNLQQKMARGALNATEKGLVDEMEKLGVIGTGQYGGDIAKEVGQELGKSTINPFSQRFIGYRANRTLGSGVEDNAKIAHYLSKRAEGYGSKQAAESVKKYLFDYGDLTDTEKGLLKRVMPFYTWTSKNIPLQVQQFIEKPGKFSKIATAKKNIEQGVAQSDEKYMSDYMKQNAPIRVKTDKDGNTLYFLSGAWLPASQAITFLSDPVSNALGMVSPMAKLPYENLTGKGTFFKNTLGQYEDIQKYPGQKTSYLGMDLNPKTVNNLRSIRALNELNNLNPGGIFGGKNSPSIFKGLLPNASNVRGGQNTPETSQQDRVLNSFIGKLQSYNPEQSKNYYDRDTQNKVTEFNTAINRAISNDQTELASSLIKEMEQFVQQRNGEPNKALKMYNLLGEQYFKDQAQNKMAEKNRGNIRDDMKKEIRKGILEGNNNLIIEAIKKDPSYAQQALKDALKEKVEGGYTPEQQKMLYQLEQIKNKLKLQPFYAQ
jgi:hypothetical protein